MRVCPHRVALAEQWIRQDDNGREGNCEIAVAIVLLRSVLCVRDTCGEHVCIVQIEAMSEGEFMDCVLEQLRTGRRQPYSTLTDADHEAIETEHIGEEFSRSPFLY